MSDTAFEVQSPIPYPNTYNPILLTGGMTPGMVVAASATPNHVAAANASDIATAYVTGMLLGAAPTTVGERSNVRYSGVVALPAADWVLATEEGTALTPGVPYFASDSAPGKITKTPPSGEGDFPEQVGIALSPVAFLVQIAGEGIVGPQGPAGPAAARTAQHLTTAGNHGVIDPSTDVTFITAGEDADGVQTCTLAVGTSDGQAKDINYAATLPGDSLAISGASSGMTPSTGFTIPNTGGGVRLNWDATAGMWKIIAGQDASVV